MLTRPRPITEVAKGDVLQGVVTKSSQEGAFLDIGCEAQGFVQTEFLNYPACPGDYLVQLRVVRVDVEDGLVTLRPSGERVRGEEWDEDHGFLQEHDALDELDWQDEEEEEGERAQDEEKEKPGDMNRFPCNAGNAVCGAVVSVVEESDTIHSGAPTNGLGPGDELPALVADRADSRSPQITLSADVVVEASSAQRVPLLLQHLAASGSSCGGGSAAKAKSKKMMEIAAKELAAAVAESAQPAHAMALATAALKTLMLAPGSAQAALVSLREIHMKLGRLAEPFMVRLLPQVLALHGDKDRAVQLAAQDTAETIIVQLNPYSVESVCPALLACMKQREKTEVKIAALQLLSLLQDEETQRPLALCLHEITPRISEMLVDVRADVRRQALSTAKLMFECAGNHDLGPYLDSLLEAMSNQERIPSCVEQLCEIVFVQSVETPALAVVTPILLRGLRDRDERTKRRALVVIDNMCKLVPDVKEIQPFLPLLLPVVTKAKDTISDPEVRNVAERCFATLDQADKADRRKHVDKNDVAQRIKEKLPEERRGEAVIEVIVRYVASLCATMSRLRAFDGLEWVYCLTPYLAPQLLTALDCEALVPELLENCYDMAEGDDVDDAEDEEGYDLCNCVFTLGYGALTLLNNTRLHLKRGCCYGLCGPNDCGKSTLLKAINNEQVDGFPPKSELVTAFVEHGIGEKEPECEWTPLEYMFADETIQAMQIPKKKVVAALRSLGFDNQKLKSEIGHLSGGWKMKLGLARAILMCADILLFDEPTGHLDMQNVAWLAGYIDGLKNDANRPVTTIVVSHDTAFLDKVCTHIINVRQRKLKTYRGNISDFVRRCPEARAYLTLSNERVKFCLPEPGMLEGVKSKGKKLLRMQNVTYTYPGCEGPTLYDVSIEVSMLSRVAVVGPNGAGKSTMIKALVGELPLTDGRSAVWRHPNVRISYVAQHAFHHLEKHLHQTATQYILERFAGGEDTEAHDFRAAAQTGPVRRYYLRDGHLVKCQDAKDEKKAAEPEYLLGRRKARTKGPTGEDRYEYSVKWRGMREEDCSWVDRDRLLEMGHLRLAQREDERQAAVHGLVSRALTQPQVEEHLRGFGLDASFASHQRLGVLSGGQKVKVVLGAATWLSPHILILDEPTNYLDRDSLGALAAGLADFGGGVIIVSHNREFANAVCDERWVMDAGRLTREGELNKADVKIEAALGPDEYTDEHGNRTIIERKKALSEKELKRYRKQKELRRKRGEEVSDDEEEWWESLQRQTSAATAGAT